MALDKLQKQKIIEELREKIKRQKSIVFVNFSGVGVKELFELREKMKESNCEFKIAKKTLIKIAFKEEKIGIPENLEGEIGLGFGYQDEILPFKILADFSKRNENLKILGGFIEEFFGEEKAERISQIPSKNELWVCLIRGLSAPASNLLNVLGGNMRNLIYILSQLNPAEKRSLDN